MFIVPVSSCADISLLSSFSDSGSEWFQIRWAVLFGDLGGVDKGELPVDLQLILCLVSAGFEWVEGDKGGGRRVVS